MPTFGTPRSTDFKPWLSRRASYLTRRRRDILRFLGQASPGFRNRLVHAYADVRLDRVWQVIERDLGPLREAARAELSRELDRGKEQDTGLDIGF